MIDVVSERGEGGEGVEAGAPMLLLLRRAAGLQLAVRSDAAAASYWLDSGRTHAVTPDLLILLVFCVPLRLSGSVRTGKREKTKRKKKTLKKLLSCEY